MLEDNKEDLGQVPVETNDGDMDIILSHNNLWPGCISCIATCRRHGAGNPLLCAVRHAAEEGKRRACKRAVLCQKNNVLCYKFVPSLRTVAEPKPPEVFKGRVGSGRGDEGAVIVGIESHGD